MPNRLRKDAGCPYEATAQAMKRIGGRWKVLIIRYLLDNRSSGFNELERALEGVSPKMLSQQLSELREDGILHRHELVSAPPKVAAWGGRALGG